MSWPAATVLIALTLGTAYVLPVLYELSGKLRPAKHPCADTCTPVVIGVKPLEGENLAFKQTVVLKRCTRCGAHIAVGYAGVWTVEEFLKREADEAQFARMMR
jgi:hypothetical protein